jgi:hypothetical protein
MNNVEECYGKGGAYYWSRRVETQGPCSKCTQTTGRIVQDRPLEPWKHLCDACFTERRPLSTMDVLNALSKNKK